MGSDLVPIAIELLDGEALRAAGAGERRAGAPVGFDGIAEQVDWQCAEVSRLVAPLGLVTARVLDGPARDRGVARRGARSGARPSATSPRS